MKIKINKMEWVGSLSKWKNIIFDLFRNGRYGFLKRFLEAYFMIRDISFYFAKMKNQLILIFP